MENQIKIKLIIKLSIYFSRYQYTATQGTTSLYSVLCTALLCS